MMRLCVCVCVCVFVAGHHRRRHPHHDPPPSELFALKRDSRAFDCIFSAVCSLCASSPRFFHKFPFLFWSTIAPGIVQSSSLPPACNRSISPHHPLKPGCCCLLSCCCSLDFLLGEACLQPACSCSHLLLLLLLLTWVVFLSTLFLIQQQVACV